MSVKVMSAVWAGYPGESSPELLVLLALADWSDDEGRCFPSIATVGKKCRIGRSQTQRVIHRLIAGGLVVVTDNANGGAPGSTRRYRIDLDRLTGSETATGRRNATGSETAADGPRKCAETGRENATQYVSEPSIEASTKEKAPTRTRATYLPADWSLPADWQAWALKERPEWTPDQCQWVAAIFADHWHAAAGAKAARADWLATWRNWVRRQDQFQAKPSGHVDKFAARAAVNAGLTGSGGSGHTFDRYAARAEVDAGLCGSGNTYESTATPINAAPI